MTLDVRVIRCSKGCNMTPHMGLFHISLFQPARPPYPKKKRFLTKLKKNSFFFVSPFFRPRYFFLPNGSLITQKFTFNTKTIVVDQRYFINTSEIQHIWGGKNEKIRHMLYAHFFKKNINRKLDLYDEF